MEKLNHNHLSQMPEVPDFEYDNREHNKTTGSKSLGAIDSYKESNDRFGELTDNSNSVHKLTASDIENMNPEIMESPELFASYLIYGTTNEEAINDYEQSHRSATRIFNSFYNVGYATDGLSDDANQAPVNIDTFFDNRPDTDINQFMEALPEGFIVKYISAFARHGADVEKIFCNLSPDMLKRILKEPHGYKFQEFRELEQKEKPVKSPRRVLE